MLPITPVAGSILLAEKVSWFSELSQNSNSERLFQSKTSNLVKWTKLILVDFSANSPPFTINLGDFSLYVSFSKRAVECMGDLWIHSTDINRKRSSEFEFWVSSENRKIFSAGKFDRATGVIHPYPTLAHVWITSPITSVMNSKIHSDSKNSRNPHELHCTSCILVLH